jgi:hypothetical protein
MTGRELVAALRRPGALLVRSTGKKGSPAWNLRTGARNLVVDDRVVQPLIAEGRVVGDRDVLFEGLGVPSQVYRVRQ